MTSNDRVLERIYSSFRKSNKNPPKKLEIRDHTWVNLITRSNSGLITTLDKIKYATQRITRQSQNFLSVFFLNSDQDPLRNRVTHTDDDDGDYSTDLVIR